MHDLSLPDFEYYVRVIDKVCYGSTVQHILCDTYIQQLITNDKSARARKVPAGGAGDH
jgi:hypothetical protein